MVITNPPFSLFRQFIPWVEDGDVQYSIIGNLNAITYKEVFYLIERNDLWLGSTISGGDREFQVPSSYPLEALNTCIDNDGKRYVRVTGVRWFTNIQHGKRYDPLELVTLEENLESNNRIIKNENSYKKYDYYDAIEVPFTSGIPSDYDGIMGVPISFLDKYCPEQFDIIGCSHNHRKPNSWDKNVSMNAMIEGKSIYKRLFIQNRNDSE